MTEPLSVAEVLTKQFYDWELRGRGWQVWESPVEPEPPFRPFTGHHLPRDFFHDDGQLESPLSRWTAGLFGKSTAALPASGEPPPAEEEPAPDFIETLPELIEMQVALPPASQPKPEVFEQLLSSLHYCRQPLAFEVVGTAESMVMQVVAERSDVGQVALQLKAHFPDAVIAPQSDYLTSQWERAEDAATVLLDFGLDREFMLPLATKPFAVDPLVGVTGTLERLGVGELGALQILFAPARKPWAESIVRAVCTADGEPFFENAPEMLAAMKLKLSRPLYTVVVRVAARSPDEQRAWQIAKGLAGALYLFQNRQGNELVALDNEFDDWEHGQDFLHRLTRRSGMLLNSDELVALVHLPTAAVRSPKLQRQTKTTKAAPDFTTNGSVLLGANEHEGVKRQVMLTPEQRMRHTHIIGASGTGKSTLLLNLIVQDIHRGEGLAVLDPHGDLIDKILDYIPPGRWDDVVMVDPSDEAFPVGFNILSAHTDLERTLLASDLVGVFQRLSTSWGDQMTSVLGNAILAFLESDRGGTLPELRRFLIEPEFRKDFLKSVKDPEVVYYWQKEFGLVGGKSLGPLLTRLDTFLRPKAIRYMVGQKANRLNFGDIMDTGKIVLAKLPQGLIGEENAFLLGSVLVGKLQQMAMARQAQQVAARKDFYLYIDEFHHFITPSMTAILTGARKYRLGLILAHQEVRQLQRDSDVAGAVMANPATRICFRVGDEDARRLSESFASFTAQDLQNLDIGEALCRVERFDFNLCTAPLPPAASNTATREAIYQRSRQKYASARSAVEEEFAKNRVHVEPEPAERVDPFAKRKAKVETVAPQSEAVEAAPVETRVVGHPATLPVVPKPPPVSEVPKPPQPQPLPTQPGKGGPDHRRMQETFKLLAERLGWRASIEESVPGGSVDVAFYRGTVAVACEISVTNGPDNEVGNLRKCLRGAFTHIVMVCAEPKHLAKIETATKEAFPTAELGKVHFLEPDGLLKLLEELTAAQAGGENTVKGYRVSTSYKTLTDAQKQGRKQDMGGAVVRALLRGKEGGKP